MSLCYPLRQHAHLVSLKGNLCPIFLLHNGIYCLNLMALEFLCLSQTYLNLVHKAYTDSMHSYLKSYK